MKRFLTIASRVDRKADSLRPVLNAVGWVCFALITADYARFIDLPALVTIPLWIGVCLNLFRWAVWEGMIKPRLPEIADRQSSAGEANPPPPTAD